MEVSDMKRKNIMILGIVFLSLLALPVFAHGPWSGRGGDECGYGRSWFGDNLTAEQQAELRELRQEYLDQTRQLREDAQTKMREMNTLLQSGSPDEKQVRQVQKELNTVRAKLADARVDHILKVKKVDPEAFAGRYGSFGWKGYGRDRAQARRDCPNAL